MYAFRLGGDSKKKLKSVPKSYSKKIIFEEFKNCLEGKKIKKNVKIIF